MPPTRVACAWALIYVADSAAIDVFLSRELAEDARVGCPRDAPDWLSPLRIEEIELVTGSSN
jgi:hypothetical protein